MPIFPRQNKPEGQKARKKVKRLNVPFRTLTCTDEYPLVTFLTLRTTLDILGGSKVMKSKFKQATAIDKQRKQSWDTQYKRRVRVSELLFSTGERKKKSNVVNDRRERMATGMFECRRTVLQELEPGNSG